jgi:hypothetical protein
MIIYKGYFKYLNNGSIIKKNEMLFYFVSLVKRISINFR